MSGPALCLQPHGQSLSLAWARGWGRILPGPPRTHRGERPERGGGEGRARWGRRAWGRARGAHGDTAGGGEGGGAARPRARGSGRERHGEEGNGENRGGPGPPCEVCPAQRGAAAPSGRGHNAWAPRRFLRSQQRGPRRPQRHQRGPVTDRRRGQPAARLESDRGEVPGRAGAARHRGRYRLRRRGEGGEGGKPRGPPVTRRGRGAPESPGTERGAARCRPPSGREESQPGVTGPGAHPLTRWRPRAAKPHSSHGRPGLGLQRGRGCARCPHVGCSPGGRAGGPGSAPPRAAIGPPLPPRLISPRLAFSLAFSCRLAPPRFPIGEQRPPHANIAARNRAAVRGCCYSASLRLGGRARSGPAPW